MLPAGSPLKCTSPADVYMLLKSSDFVLHDLDRAALFEACEGGDDQQSDYELELVLRKWYPVDRSRELRCFVRREKLLGASYMMIMDVCLDNLELQASHNVTQTTTTFGTNRRRNQK